VAETRSDRIASWYNDFPAGLIAGQVSIQSPDEAARRARALAEAGLAVHVQFSATDSAVLALRRIAHAARPWPVDVHLTGVAHGDEVMALAKEALAVRPRRIMIPWAAFTPPVIRMVRQADVRACVAVWDEWDGTRWPAQWATDPDGILVMLSEPGAPERCRVRHIALVSATTRSYPAIPVIVAGGITEAIARLCRSAGAREIVVGQALTAKANDHA
jgi:pentose-5-phosphate-3-epimerase